LNLAGVAPSLALTVVVPSGSLNVLGFAPQLTENKIVTPTGGTTVLGSAPSVVVAGKIFVPATGSLSIVGSAPSVPISRVITPPTRALVLLGSAPTLQNPNWVIIDDSQTPNWQPIAA
jgi:hypothetical protein